MFLEANNNINKLRILIKKPVSISNTNLSTDTDSDLENSKITAEKATLLIYIIYVLNSSYYNMFSSLFINNFVLNVVDSNHSCNLTRLNILLQNYISLIL